MFFEKRVTFSPVSKIYEKFFLTLIRDSCNNARMNYFMAGIVQAKEAGLSIEELANIAQLPEVENVPKFNMGLQGQLCLHKVVAEYYKNDYKGQKIEIHD